MLSDSFKNLSMNISIENSANQELTFQFPNPKNIRADIKRLDLIHPEVNGNKWFKLMYNIQKANESEPKTILTFGGPWSNHIYATASAGLLAGIKTIGIIRGEEPLEWSSTLLHAKACGMQLEFITRLAYAEKETEDFVGWLHEEFGSFHLVPEGGSNYLGINGCMEILTELDKKQYDYICCSCGTAATLAGILLSAGSNQKVIGFASMKGGGFLRDEVTKHIRYFLMNDELAEEYSSQFEIMTDYHFGGYGKWNEELIDFIKQSKIPFDQIYTGKMMYGLFDMIEKNYFPDNARILVIHSGGLQGLKSLAE